MNRLMQAAQGLLGNVQREPGYIYGDILPVRAQVNQQGQVIPGSREWGLGYSNAARGLLDAFSLPGRAIAGEQVTPQQAMEMAMNVTAPGVATARYTPGLLNMPMVYHGTPHRFEPTPDNPLGEFRASQIGTGEGAQAYGHGVYVAESPAVAKSYVSAGGSRTTKPDAYAADIVGMMGGEQKALAHLKSIMPKKGETTFSGESPELIEQAIKNIESGAYKVQQGSLYTADLPDEMVDRMLDWDKPLSEQPEVIKALKGTDYEVGMSQKEAEKIADMRLRQEADEWAEMTGGDPVDYSNNVDWEKYVDQVRKESGSIDSSITGKDLHLMVMRDEGYRPDLFDTENYQVSTSEALRSYGISGIKYLDATSRDAGKGTRNFVLFPGEEKKAKIIKRE